MDSTPAMDVLPSADAKSTFFCSEFSYSGLWIDILWVPVSFYLTSTSASADHYSVLHSDYSSVPKTNFRLPYFDVLASIGAVNLDPFVTGKYYRSISIFYFSLVSKDTNEACRKFLRTFPCYPIAFGWSFSKMEMADLFIAESHLDDMNRLSEIYNFPRPLTSCKPMESSNSLEDIYNFRRSMIKCKIQFLKLNYRLNQVLRTSLWPSVAYYLSHRTYYNPPPCEGSNVRDRRIFLSDYLFVFALVSKSTLAACESLTRHPDYVYQKSMGMQVFRYMDHYEPDSYMDNTHSNYKTLSCSERIFDDEDEESLDYWDHSGMFKRRDEFGEYFGQKRYLRIKILLRNHSTRSFVK